MHFTKWVNKRVAFSCVKTFINLVLLSSLYVFSSSKFRLKLKPLQPPADAENRKPN